MTMKQRNCLFLTLGCFFLNPEPLRKVLNKEARILIANSESIESLSFPYALFQTPVDSQRYQGALLFNEAMYDY